MEAGSLGIYNSDMSWMCPIHGISHLIQMCDFNATEQILKQASYVFVFQLQIVIIIVLMYELYITLGTRD